MGVYKKMRDFLDAILLLQIMPMIHINTMCSRYVMLGLVKLKPYMSYDMQVMVRKTRTCSIVTKCTRVMEKQNMSAFWKRKTRTHYGEEKHMHVMENHKNWFWCMAREMNKNNILHRQYLGPIVIFLHHQEQHLKQPFLTSKSIIFLYVVIWTPLGGFKN